MRDVARRVELISLPLRLTMVADRAEAALTRLEQTSKIDDLARDALERILSFVEDAGRGLDISRSTSMRGYSREAISAYRISEKVLTAQPADSGKTRDTKELLDDLKRDVRAVLDTPHVVDPGKVEELNDFFHRLAQVCLSLNVRVVERVARAETRTSPA